jgi:hypothetical protein
MLSVCLRCLWIPPPPPPINFWMPEPNVMKRGMYNMTPEPIWTEYFMNPSMSLWVCMFGIFLLSLLCKGSVKKLPRQWIHTQEQKNYWIRIFFFSPRCCTVIMFRLFKMLSFLYNVTKSNLCGSLVCPSVYLLVNSWIYFLNILFETFSLNAVWQLRICVVLIQNKLWLTQDDEWTMDILLKPFHPFCWNSL